MFRRQIAAAAHCAMFGFSGQPMPPPAYPSGWPVSRGESLAGSQQWGNSDLWGQVCNFSGCGRVFLQSELILVSERNSCDDLEASRLKAE